MQLRNAISPAVLDLARVHRKRMEAEEAAAAATVAVVETVAVEDAAAATTAEEAERMNIHMVGSRVIEVVVGGGIVEMDEVEGTAITPSFKSCRLVYSSSFSRGRILVVYPSYEARALHLMQPSLPSLARAIMH